MKRIFACILIVLLLSALFVACGDMTSPNNTTPGVTITPKVSPSPADGNNLTPNVTGNAGTGDNQTGGTGVGNNVNTGNGTNNAINRARTPGRNTVNTPTTPTNRNGTGTR